MFSLLWSEHCGYKHSALLLRRLPSEGPRVLQGPGENAGVLDLGEGLAVAFKVESHNHPSAVEPFQGAATGVGGILRDISAMGARPVALLDGLRFGAPDDHFSRAVGGIGHYGNCVGVPNVGGEVVFDDVVRVELPRQRDVRRAAPGRAAHAREGDRRRCAWSSLYGATTGRDGIGGASVLASAELGEDDADKRPSVQVGDPFTGKRLIEVSVELVERGLVLSLQDCGAAGLASSLSEMAADYGIDVHLDRVPQREEGMEPWEVMISESQERMVAIVAPGAARRRRGGDRPLGAPPRRDRRGDRDRAPASALGRRGGRRRSRRACSPTSAPATRSSASRASRRPRARRRVPADAAGAARAARLPRAPLARVRHPPLRPARPVAHRTPAGARRGRAAAAPGVARARPDARRPGPARGARPARSAAQLAILEAARNVACAGGEPLGFTDCLNFGNPEKPEVGWELAEAIEGMALACEALGVPIVSGNVSLYNDTDGRSIPPTPVVGCVGLVADVRRVPRGWREGDAILLARSRSPLTLAGSEAQARWGRLGGSAVARPRVRGRARAARERRRAARLARPRRRRGRARGRARRGGALERARRRARPRRTTRSRSSARSAAR